MNKQLNLYHFIYCLIIGVLLSVGLWTFTFIEDTAFVTSVGFAASLVSIVIGVLAVFIAMYQGLTQSESVEKIKTASDRVERVTKDFSQISEMKETLESIYKNIDGADFRKMTKDMESLSKKFSNENFEGVKSHGINSEDFKLEENMIHNLLNVTYDDLIFNYLLISIYRSKVAINIKDFTINYLNITDKKNYIKISIDLGVFKSILVRYTNLNEFDIEYDDLEVKVIKLPSVFIEYFDEFGDHDETLKKVKKEIDEYVRNEVIRLL